MRKSRVAAVIVHFGDGDLTRRCLESLARELQPMDCLYLVDNSHDWEEDSELMAKFRVRHAEILRPRRANPGFSKGANLGSRAAAAQGADHFLFVNNDTVFEEGAVTALALVLDGDDSVGAVGPVLWSLPQPGEVWSSGGEFPRASVRPKLERHRALGKTAEEPFETEFLSGCVLMVPARLHSDGSVFAEEYLFGGEEWELSARLTRAGKRLLVIPASVVHHDATVDDGHGRSHTLRDPRFLYNSYSNRLLFLERNRGFVARLGSKLALFGYLLVLAPLRGPSVHGVTGTAARVCFYWRLVLQLFWKRRPHQVMTFEHLEAVRRELV